MWLMKAYAYELLMVCALILAACCVAMLLYALAYPGSDVAPQLRAWWRRRQIRRYTRKVLKQARQQHVEAGAVTDKWLREKRREASRIEFHGPRIAWPIQKDVH